MFHDRLYYLSAILRMLEKSTGISFFAQTSDQCFQSFTIQKVEQFQRGAAGVFLADLPLADSRQTHIQYRGQHRLTQPVSTAQSADFFARVWRHRSKAKTVVLPQSALVDKSPDMKIPGGFMNCVPKSAGFSFHGHGQSISLGASEGHQKSDIYPVK